jgi:ribonuclease BN (tRNA processing enzyme)
MSNLSVNELLILGCGHSESMVHFNNNAVVLSDQGNMLIDCGYTIKHALHAQGLTFADIDAVYISHVHGDHAYGLERLAYETRYKLNKKVTLFVHQDTVDVLWHNTLKGSLGFNGEGTATLEDYFDVRVVSRGAFEFASNEYRLIEVKHTPNMPTHGLLINDSVFYTTDTSAIPETIHELSFELCFHDVTLTDYNPVHATIHTLIEQYPLTIRKKMLLMSYEDHWQDYESLANDEFSGFAKQGMRVPLIKEKRSAEADLI